MPDLPLGCWFFCFLLCHPILLLSASQLQKSQSPEAVNHRFYLFFGTDIYLLLVFLVKRIGEVMYSFNHLRTTEYVLVLVSHDVL